MGDKSLVTVHLAREREDLTCAEGTNLYELLAQKDLVDGPCGGKGVCGKCRVVVDGVPTLACTYVVLHDSEVITTPKEEIQDIVSSGYHIDVVPDPVPVGSYGVVVDIGTTTVVATLVDLVSGKELRSASTLNSQKAYGQDVITRIHYTIDNPGGTATLAQLIREDIMRLVGDVSRETCVPITSIIRIVICANTTMIHLFAGVDASSLARAPFVPALHGAQVGRATDYGLALPAAELFCVPAVAAYVGGDIVSGIMACDLMHSNKRTLFIDIGTNGEIVLSDRSQLVTCSCAAGPALEGMNISCGMRASEGAIEDVDITDAGVSYKTIGNGAPRGICGSGIVAAIGEGVRAGAIGKTGRLNKNHAAVELRDKRPVMVLDAAHDIVLTQGDVRQVQLAKGAILSGVEALLHHQNLSADQIEEVIVAGQFGAHLKASNLVDAGFFPQAWREKIIYAGNTSQSGGLICLLSHDVRARSEHVGDSATYLELSLLEGYDRLFVDAMSFER